MTTVLETETIEAYLSAVQNLKILSSRDPSCTEQLMETILQEKEAHEDHEEIEPFFKGEYAFYNNNFEQALTHYMRARTVPYFEFFCYRATAFVSFSRGDLEKSLSFLEKALDLRPNDYACLNLLLEIYHKQEKAERARQVLERIQAVTAAILPEEETEEEEKEETDPVARGLEPATANEPEHSRELPLKVDNLWKEEPREKPVPATSAYIATKLGVDLECEKALENRIQSFQNLQNQLIETYLSEAKKERALPDKTLYILNGWNNPQAIGEEKKDPQTLISQLLLNEQSRKNTGGLFIRWQGKGIVINPGPNFLDHFHDQGLYINDIDYVIVTRETPEAYQDIKRIYRFNYQLNKICPELHIIHYYLNHISYQDLSPILKPNFKQERNTVHSMELFLDSPDVEKEQLAEGISLSYFSTSSRAGFTSEADFKEPNKDHQPHCLGIRLEFASRSSITRIGYISGTSWSPLLAHHLGKVDLLITGFGSTNPNDYGKLGYNENCLGYFGTYTLLEELRPALLLCSEFDGREGDIRLEAIKKLRREFKNSYPQQASATAVLPADNGLRVDLAKLNVHCSVTGAPLKPDNVVVSKTKDTFGSLKYLSSDCLL